MTTEVSKKDSGKMGMLKPFIQPAAKVGAAIVGFTSGHLAFSNMPASLKGGGLKGFGIALAIALVSIFASTKVKNVHLQNGMLGLGVYSGVKAVNSLTTIVPTTTQGLGAYQLPKGAIDVLNKLFPTLGAAEPIHVDFSGMEIYDHTADLGNAVDQTYEFVNGYEGVGAMEDDSRVSLAGYENLNVRVA
jgi:hypothetical protein